MLYMRILPCGLHGRPSGLRLLDLGNSIRVLPWVYMYISTVHKLLRTGYSSLQYTADVFVHLVKCQICILMLPITNTCNDVRILTHKYCKDHLIVSVDFSHGRTTFTCRFPSSSMSYNTHSEQTSSLMCSFVLSQMFFKPLT